MKVLIVYAHPKTEGHSPETLRQVEKKLKGSNSEYEIIDLYKIGYDPILKSGEHYTAGNRNVDQQNLEIQERITEADNLIFIYPVWWGTMPAMMKGFFDRVLTPKFAFAYNKGKIDKLLTGKKAVVFASSGGSRFDYFPVDVAKFVVKRVILEFCGIETKVVRLYKARKLEDNIDKIKSNVEEGFRFLGV